jgi:hypothetical protein
MEGESFNRNPAHDATSAKASVPAPNVSTNRQIVQPADDWICRANLARLGLDVKLGKHKPKKED